MCNPSLPPVVQFTSQQALLEAMVRSLCSWAAEQKIRIVLRPLPGLPLTSITALQCTLLNIFRQLDQNSRPVFILLDEIQRFFDDDVSERVKLGYSSLANFFKDLVSPSMRRNRVNVAATGSSWFRPAWASARLLPTDTHWRGLGTP